MRTRTTLASVLVALATIAAGRIAAEQLAARTTEDWIKTLDAPARVAAMRVGDVIGRLKLAPGQVVADLGAGTGAFSLPLAKAVGPAGRVYAVEINKASVGTISRKSADSGTGQRADGPGYTESDPRLPVAAVDVAFMHDVLHHVSDRAAYLTQAARYVKPRGRFVIIDPDPALGPHKGDPALVVSKAQANDWMKAAGFVPIDDVSMFTDRWFVIYERQ